MDVIGALFPLCGMQRRCAEIPSTADQGLLSADLIGLDAALTAIAVLLASKAKTAFATAFANVPPAPSRNTDRDLWWRPDAHPTRQGCGCNGKRTDVGTLKRPNPRPSGPAALTQVIPTARKLFPNHAQ